MTTNFGRMGTAADAVFASNAMAAIADAAERSASSGGLTGTRVSDDSGTYLSVTGTGTPEVGMFFPSEGTDASDEMVSRVRSAMGSGLLVVIDPDACELAVYMVDEGGHRMASVLMSERSHPDRVSAAHVVLGGALPGHYLADDAVE